MEVGSGVEGIKVSGRRVGWKILGKPLKVGGQAPGQAASSLKEMNEVGETAF